jgi:alpha-tubulin suppressor-like RCC1 family protein
MTNEEVKKIYYERELVKNRTCNEVKLWGCGNNKNGQLGTASGIFFKVPVLIPLPELRNKQDYIEKVVTGKYVSKYSMILTKFGEVFITGNYDLKAIITEQEEKIANEKLTAKNNKDNNNYSIKKDKQKSSLNAKPTVIVKWQNISDEVCYHES